MGVLLVIVIGLSGCGPSPTDPAAIVYVPIGSGQGAVTTSATRLEPALSFTTLERESGQGTESGATVTQEHTVSEDPFEDNLPLAARVNHQPIFLAAYQREVARFEQALVADGVDLTSEQGQETLTQIQRQVLEALIDQAIIEQQAIKLNISITEETLAAKIQESIVQTQSQAQFDTWLTANGLTYEEFEARLHAQLIANKVFDYITYNILEKAEKEQTFANWLVEQRSLAVIERYVAL